MSVRERLENLEERVASDGGDQPEWLRRRMEEKRRAAEERPFDEEGFRRTMEAGFVMQCRRDFDRSTRAEVLASAEHLVGSFNALRRWRGEPEQTAEQVREQAERWADNFMGMSREEWDRHRAEWFHG